MFVLAVMAGVFAVQNVFVTQLFPQYSASNTPTSDLSKVAAVGGCPVPALDGVEDSHPTFDPAVAEGDPFNNFGPAIGGLSRASDSKQKFESVIPAGSVLDGAIELVEAMTPSGTYANQNPERPSDGTVIKIKTTPGQVIKAPDSGRKISGDGERYIGMVMYATADGVRFANSRNDKPTGTEGYNLYIWGINTDSSVVSNYRRGHDEFRRKCFPQFKPGDRLGTAKGDFIYMALRDNGDFVTIRDTSWWDGKVTNGQGATGGGGTVPTATPQGGGTLPTATPQGGGTVPTATPQGGGTVPTATPQGGGQTGADVFNPFSIGSLSVVQPQNEKVLQVPFCWSIKSGKSKDNLTAALNSLGEINLKINGTVVTWGVPEWNFDTSNLGAIITNKYSGSSTISPLSACENVVIFLRNLSSFGTGNSHNFQIVPQNNASLSSGTITRTGLLAELTPSATPGPGTPTVAAPTPTGSPPTPTIRVNDGTSSFRVEMGFAGNPTCTDSRVFCLLSSAAEDGRGLQLRMKQKSGSQQTISVPLTSVQKNGGNFVLVASSEYSLENYSQFVGLIFDVGSDELERHYFNVNLP